MRALLAVTTAAAVLGLVPAAPSATAAGATTVAVAGTMTFNGPLPAPCTTATCPPTVIPSPPPFLGKLGPPFSVEGGALRSGSFTQATCLPAPCSVVLSMSYRGYCGLATGRGSGGLLDSAGEAHLLEYTFTVAGTEMVVRGNARRYSTGEVGDLWGTFTAVPTDATCTALTLVGDLAATYPKVTP